jgi:hypothetical protein
MSTALKVQEISVAGHLAGVVIEDQLLLRAGLDRQAVQTAQAMGLLAIDIHTGATAGPYSQLRAHAFAASCAGGRAAARGVEGPGC